PVLARHFEGDSPMPVFRVWRKLLKSIAPIINESSRPAKKRRSLQLEILEDRAVPTIWYVAPTGSDNAGNGTDPSKPFRSVQLAVNNAFSGDVVKVAAGTYNYNPQDDTTQNSLGTTAIVAVVGKQVTLLGGFTPSDFTTADPTNNVTILDGSHN